MLNPGIYYFPSKKHGYKIYVFLFSLKHYSAPGSRSPNAIEIARGLFLNADYSLAPHKAYVFSYEEKDLKPFDKLPRPKQRVVAEHVGKYRSQQKRGVLRQIFKAL